MSAISISYLAAAFNPKSFPHESLPEFAIIGRSNVGKSSLINSLAGGKKIARTSKTPGKTRALHFYQVNRDYFLVDLPGYGFARVPLDERNKWDKLATVYLTSRTKLVEVLLLIDARLSPTRLDLNMISWLLSHSISFSIIATKMDKLKSSKQAQTIKTIKESLAHLGLDLTILPFSSMTNLGKKEILSMLYAKSQQALAR
ncbi:YihA family ribosome biogenesis GTP-binding protein [bacterium]|nr:YihA family ribosome biogenesis GTP-binding protein [bacterium]